MAAPKKKPAATRKKSTKQVMDVARPGKTQPSASSRPVIVGHKPVVQDPMVNEGKKMPETSDSEEHKITVKRTSPKVIAPLKSAEDIAAEAKEEESATPELPIKPDEPEVPEVEQSAETEGTDAPEEPAIPEEESEATVPESTPEPEESTPADTGSEKEAKSKDKDSKGKGSSSSDKGSNKKDDKKNAELERRLAEIEKLADEKKYFVHTSHTTQKQRKTGVIIALVLLLLAAGAYLTVDAQLVKNDLKLPYEFFKEEKQPEPVATTQPSVEDHDEATEQSQEEEAKPAQSAAAKDAQREADIKLVQSTLETYFADNGYYPTLGQLNDKTFRASHSPLKNLDDLSDPDGADDLFAKTPMKNSYAYESAPTGCDDTATFRCESYTATATLSDGKEYVVHSVNQ